MKFVFNDYLISEGYKVYRKNSVKLEENNLVLKLFDTFNEIEEIYFSQNFISISFIRYWSYNQDYIDTLKNIMYDFYNSSKTKLINEEYILEIQKIQLFLDEYINPATEMEGGSYQLYNYSAINKILILVPLGSCRNNASSSIDLQQIKRILENVCSISLNTITTLIS